MRKHFDFYAYSSPTDGTFRIDCSEYFSGEDFRTKKRYKEYKNAGFDILLVAADNSYSGEPFDSSACKKCMDEALKAGITRVIVGDDRLKNLCGTEGSSLIGKGCRFADENELLGYLKECIAPYKDQKNFYGVQLKDEPRWYMFKAYGEVARGLKKICPDIYLQCNLLPFTREDYYAEHAKDAYDAYYRYLNLFLDETRLDCILFDEYPFRRENITGGYTLLTYIIAAEVCKRRKVELRTVLQSFANLINGDRLVCRPINKSDMYWQTNLAMGFACKEYSFFTYFTKQDNSVKGEFFLDGCSFINRDGTRTKLYSYTKKRIAEMKKFEKVLLPYSYEECKIIPAAGKTLQDYGETKEIPEMRPSIDLDIQLDSLALITKLKSKKTLYMIENVGGDGKENMLTVNLPEGFGVAKIYLNGKFIKRVKERISIKLPYGNALFIERI